MQVHWPILFQLLSAFEMENSGSLAMIKFAFVPPNLFRVQIHQVMRPGHYSINQSIDLIALLIAFEFTSMQLCPANPINNHSILLFRIVNYKIFFITVNRNWNRNKNFVWLFVSKMNKISMYINKLTAYIVLTRRVREKKKMAVFHAIIEWQSYYFFFAKFISPIVYGL